MSDPTHQVVELLVHGVGGTLPEDMLHDPDLKRVSGDDVVSFWRPRRPPPSQDTRHLREALSWGKLTAAGASRALWLFLLPFALANFAGWTHLPKRSSQDWSERTVARATKRMVRVFSLTITAGFVLMVANVAYDLLAYQCGSRPPAGAGLDPCWESRWWLGMFKFDFFSASISRRLALATLVPVGVLAILRFSSKASYSDFEEFDLKQDHAEDEQRREELGKDPANVPLTHPDFWRGRQAVSQVRDVHAAGGRAVIALALSASLWSVAGDASVLGRLDRGIALILFGLALALLLMCLGICFNRNLTARPSAEVYTETWLSASARAMKRVTYVALLVTVLYALLPRKGPAGRALYLTGLDLTIIGFMIFQAGLLLVVFVLSLHQRREWRRSPKLPQDEVYQPAFYGLATFAVCAMSLFVLTSMWGGVVIRMADSLGCPQVSLDVGTGWDRCPRPVAPPAGAASTAGTLDQVVYFSEVHEKTAMVALVVFLSFLLLGVRVLILLRQLTRSKLERVMKDFGIQPRDVGLTPRDLGLRRKDLDSELSLAYAEERSGRKRAPNRLLLKRLKSVAGAYSHAELVRRSDGLLMGSVILGSVVALFQHLAPELERTFGWENRLFDWVTLEGLSASQRVIVAGLAVALVLGLITSVVWSDRSALWKRCLAVLPVALLSLGFRELSFLLTLSTWAVLGTSVLLSAGFYAAWRKPNARKSIGIIWDVVTFWPRHNHPYAPPCYGERLIPQLRSRLEALVGERGNRGRVLLSAHSQGTVVATATLMTLPEDYSRSVTLFTYGSPLEIIYRRHFPAYFGGGILTDLSTKMFTDSGMPGWQHYHCPTDPIGVTMTELGEQSVWAIPSPQIGHPNTQLLDPRVWQAPPGEPPFAKRGHSAYLEHPSFQEYVDYAVGRLLATPIEQRPVTEAPEVSAEKEVLERLS
ncbi:MAG: hypothetical protein ACT4OM_07835 [Actinomycetota bacterium]